MSGYQAGDGDPFKITALFAPGGTVAEPLLAQYDYPWEVLPHIRAFLTALGETLPPSAYEKRGENIWISREATVYDSAFLAGPCIICAGAEIRHCAFLRGSVLVGSGAVVGNSTELKNVILFDGVQVPHYNYVGDSVLGRGAHMGAGAITSNVKSDKQPVLIRDENGAVCFETGMKKVGAFLGDGAEIGCGSVLNPGTVVGRASSVYPLSSVRGYVPPHSIYKRRGEVVTRNEART